VTPVRCLRRSGPRTWTPGAHRPSFLPGPLTAPALDDGGGVGGGGHRDRVARSGRGPSGASRHCTICSPGEGGTRRSPSLHAPEAEAPVPATCSGQERLRQDHSGGGEAERSRGIQSAPCARGRQSDRDGPDRWRLVQTAFPAGWSCAERFLAIGFLAIERRPERPARARDDRRWTPEDRTRPGDPPFGKCPRCSPARLSRRRRAHAGDRHAEFGSAGGREWNPRAAPLPA